MNKQNFELTAKIISVGKTETFERINKPSLSKRNISLETEDGQKLFCEIRPNNFELADYLRSDQNVRIGYIFAGSDKNGKQYNNIIINRIEII